MSLIMAAAGRRYTPSSPFAFSALEVIVQKEREWSWPDVLIAEEREDVVNNVGYNRLIQDRLKECISTTRSWRKRAAPNMLFKSPGYSTL